MANIDSFEMTSCGGAELNVGGPRGTVKYSYYSVPRSVLVKLISATKVPSISDFENWIKDTEGKREKSTVEHPDAYNTFWDEPLK